MFYVQSIPRSERWFIGQSLVSVASDLALRLESLRGASAALVGLKPIKIGFLVNHNQLSNTTNSPQGPQKRDKHSRGVDRYSSETDQRTNGNGTKVGRRVGAGGQRVLYRMSLERKYRRVKTMGGEGERDQFGLEWGRWFVERYNENGS